ncbi:hypothetical protein JCM16303_007180 [Sporobolomyces ruberrimus]
MAQVVQKVPLAPPVPFEGAELGSVAVTDPGPASSTSEELETTTSSRAQRIRLMVESGDLERLRAIANEPGGYETDELRRIVWPALLGCDVKGKQREKTATLDQLSVRDDERQVKLDIARSLINYPRNISENERDGLRVRLEKAILTVLRKHPALQYFQGYHDIVSILLLTLNDDELLASATEQMSLHRIRDSMGPGLEPTLGYLKLAHRLIQRIDPEMYSLVNQAASMPFFALSWALTLFSHDLYEVAVIARLFDFLLAHNPAMISYLVVAILLTKKGDLVESLDEEDNDPAIVHSVLSQLPNLVLSDPSPPRPTTPPTPSSPTKPTSPGYAESEALFSSSSASASTTSLGQSSITSSSTLDVSESLISLSEATSSSHVLDPTSSSTLRNRRKDRFSFSSFDSDINALDDSMLSDPDIDNPAFSAFARTTSDPSPPSTPPRSASSPTRPSTSPGNDEFCRKPPRTVLVEDLIQSALDLWTTYPLTSPSPSNPPASSSLSSIDTSSILATDPSVASIEADTILGPKSCIFTYDASVSRTLSDVEAEEICLLGTDIVRLEALLPDPPPDDENDSEGEEGIDEDEDEEDEDGFEFVGPTPSSSSSSKMKNRSSKRNRKRRNTSFPIPSSMNGVGRINLGPHGWLVVGGVAVATAAVAYGVYGGGGAAGGVRGNGANGLGTGGLGLRTGTNGLMGGAGGGLKVQPGLGTDGAGELIRGWAKGANEL